LKLRLTGRDLGFLEGLNSYFLLTTKQIRRLYFKETDIRTVLRRLRKLHRADYIRRFKGGETAECIWTLCKKSEHILAQEIKLKGLNRNTLAHDLKVNDLRLHLNDLDIGQNFISGYKLRHKVSLKNPYDRARDTIPDWIFSLRIKNKIRIIALECEISYKGKRRMQDVFERYYHKKEIDYFWYIVPTESFKRKILNCFSDCHYQKYESYLWVSTFDEFFCGVNRMNFKTIDKSVNVHDLLGIDAHSPAHEVCNA
jgi:hypothetical protein